MKGYIFYNKRKSIKLHMIVTIILDIICLLFLSSCLGTVENTDPDTKKISSIPTSPISFLGITNAIPVASDAIEVYFIPISNSHLENIVYQIRYDGLDNAITVPASLLPPPDYKGEVHYTIRNLDYARTYTFSVQAKNIENNQESSSFLTATAKPFQTTTAKFRGISSLTNVTGPSGKYALNVGWVLAESSGALPGLELDGDPMYYEIILLESSKLSPSDFDNEQYGPTDGRLKFFASRTSFSTRVSGLKPATEYYVSVRCYNKLYVDNSTNSTYKRELNHEYLTLSTYSDQASNIQAEADSVVLTTPPGDEGKNALNVSWAPIIGMIDHVRIYYYKSANSFNPTSDIQDTCLIGTGNIHCQQITYDTIKSTIRDLETGAEYAVTVVACVDYSCSSGNQVFFDTQVKKVKPNLVQFYGIQSIEKPQSIDELQSIHLKIIPPDPTTGTMDGLLVRFYKNSADNILELNNPVALNNTNLNVMFSISNPSDITVSGIDPSSTEQHCFSAIPYTFESNTSINFDTMNEIFKCFTPYPTGSVDQRMLTGPTTTDFAGISSINFFNDTNAIALNWNLPTGGIYDEFIIIWREKQPTANSFDYITALYGGLSEYHIEEIPASRNTHMIFLSNNQLPTIGNTKTYEFGILTRFQLYSLYYPVSPNSLDEYSQPTPIQTISITK